MFNKLRRLLPRHLLVRADLARSGLRKSDIKLIKSIRKSRLTYLSEKKLAGIANACREIEDNNVQGDFLEAGCALGGSTILLTETKKENRPLRVYDVFDMIPPPSSNDPTEVHERYQTISKGEAIGIDGDEYYGYKDNLYDQVKINLSNYGIDLEKNHILLIKGLVQDTMRLDGKVAFAHIDVDWYDPVKHCLEQTFSNLSVGGKIILDDYFDWGGCKKATDGFLKTIEGQYSLDDSLESLIITRTRPSD